MKSQGTNGGMQVGSRAILWVVLLFLCNGRSGSGLHALYAQGGSITFISYNVENLFDTIPSADWDDSEFLPSGTKKWTGDKMLRKCSQIAEVISHVSGWEIPSLIALQEVEDDSVLNVLCRGTLLHRGGFRYICGTGSDPRGSHVALLYDPDRFEPVHCEEWPLYAARDSVYPTRNLLYVSGRLPSGQPLSVIVCHLPSRRGGDRAENARKAMVRLLQIRTDSLLQAVPARAVLVLGDFNATPESGLTASWAESVEQWTDHAADRSCRMVDVTPPVGRNGADTPPGSYYFSGYWERIDRIFVSCNMLSGASETPQLCKDSIRIALLPDRMMHRQPAPWGRPKRTYGGDIYLGGPGDHLPIVGVVRYGAVIY